MTQCPRASLKMAVMERYPKAKKLKIRMKSKINLNYLLGFIKLLCRFLVPVLRTEEHRCKPPKPNVCKPLMLFEVVGLEPAAGFLETKP